MGVEHPPIIGGRTFARRMPLEILRGRSPKVGSGPILSHLCRIGALRDGSDVRGRHLALGPQ